ncbi:MAG TPA: hypothetical protein PKK22_06380 [Bacilli bacterium]|jgi:ribosomal protein L24E|nr:hypothetical protein [Bacilli bacterium]
MKYVKCILIVVLLVVVITILLLYNYKREQLMNKSIQISNEEIFEIRIDDLSKSDFQKYYGKEVEIFLKSIKDKYISYNFMDEPPGKINGCLFTYNNRQIYIYVNTKDQKLYRIFKVPDKSNWKIENFIKLKIEKIEIYELSKKR